MSQITSWFRLNVDWHESEWLAELPWEVRAVWPIVLGHVKQNGRGGICRQPITARFCAAYDIPVTVVTALCNAAERDGALRIFDGNWEITHWEEYQQEDPTNADRQRRFREKKRAEKAKSEPEQPPTASVGDECNALRNGIDVTRYGVTPTLQDNTLQDNTENRRGKLQVSRRENSGHSDGNTAVSAPFQPNGNQERNRKPLLGGRSPTTEEDKAELERIRAERRQGKVQL